MLTRWQRPVSVGPDTRPRVGRRLVKALSSVLATVVLTALPSRLVRAQSTAVPVPAVVLAPQFAPALVPARLRFDKPVDGASIAEHVDVGSAPGSQEPHSKRGKWVLIGGAGGAAVGYVAWGVSIIHTDSPGAIVTLPIWVASGGLLGAGVGALISH
jgi:hypothetical protein